MVRFHPRLPAYALECRRRLSRRSAKREGGLQAVAAKAGLKSFGSASQAEVVHRSAKRGGGPQAGLKTQFSSCHR